MRTVTQTRAFTLIELLVVMLILSILMAVAMPLYLAAVTDSQRKSCRANMQSIADAEAAYRTRVSTHTYTTVLNNLSADLGAVPHCPSGGTYTVRISNGSRPAQNGTLVPNGGIIINCRRSGHGRFAPGVDSQ